MAVICCVIWSARYKITTSPWQYTASIYEELAAINIAPNEVIKVQSIISAYISRLIEIRDAGKACTGDRGNIVDKIEIKDAVQKLIIISPSYGIRLDFKAISYCINIIAFYWNVCDIAFSWIILSCRWSIYSLNARLRD